MTKQYRTKKPNENEDSLLQLKQGVSNQESLVRASMIIKEGHIKHMTHARVLEHFSYTRYISSLCLPPLSEVFLNRCLQKVLLTVLTDDYFTDDLSSKDYLPSQEKLNNLKVTGTKLYWLFLSIGLCQYLRKEVAPEKQLINDGLDHVTPHLQGKDSAFCEGNTKPPKTDSVLKYAHLYKDGDRIQIFTDLFSLSSTTETMRIFTQDSLPLHTEYKVTRQHLEKTVLLQYDQKEEKDVQQKRVQELLDKYPVMHQYVPIPKELNHLKGITSLDITHQDYMNGLHMFLTLKTYIWKRFWTDTIKRRLVMGIKNSTLPEEMADCDEYWIYGDPVQVKKQKDIAQNIDDDQGPDEENRRSSTNFQHVLPSVTIDKSTGRFVTLQSAANLNLHVHYLIPIRQNTIVHHLPWFVPKTDDIAQLLKDGKPMTQAKGFYPTVLSELVFSFSKFPLPEFIDTFMKVIKDSYAVPPTERNDMEAFNILWNRVKEYECYYRPLFSSCKSDVYVEFPFDHRFNALEYSLDFLLNSERVMVSRVQVVSLRYRLMELLKNEKHKAILHHVLMKTFKMPIVDILAKVDEYFDMLLVLHDMTEDFTNLFKKETILAHNDYTMLHQPFLFVEVNRDTSPSRSSTESSASKTLEIAIEIGEHEVSGSILDIPEESERCGMKGVACNLKAVLKIPYKKMLLINNSSTLERPVGSSVDLRTQGQKIKRGNESTHHTSNTPNPVRVLFADTEKDDENSTSSSHSSDNEITLTFTDAKTPYYFKKNEPGHALIHHFAKIGWTLNVTEIVELSKPGVVHRIGLGHLVLMLSAPVLALIYDSYRNTELLDTVQPNIDYVTSQLGTSYHLLRRSDTHVRAGRKEAPVLGPGMQFEEMLYTGSFNAHTPDDPVNYHTVMMNYLKSKYLQDYYKRQAEEAEKAILKNITALQTSSIATVSSSSSSTSTQYKRDTLGGRNLATLQTTQVTPTKVNAPAPESSTLAQSTDLVYKRKKWSEMIHLLQNCITCLEDTLSSISTYNPPDWIFADRFTDNFGNVNSFSARKGPNLTLMDPVGRFYESTSIINYVKNEVAKNYDSAIPVHQLQPTSSLSTADSAKLQDPLEASRLAVRKIIRHTFSPIRDYYAKKLSILRTSRRKEYELALRRPEEKRFNLTTDREERDTKLKQFRERDVDDDRRLYEETSGIMYKNAISTRVAFANEENRRIYWNAMLFENKSEGLFTGILKKLTGGGSTSKSIEPKQQTPLEMLHKTMEESPFYKETKKSMAKLQDLKQDMDFTFEGGQEGIFAYTKSRVIKNNIQSEISRGVMSQLSTSVPGMTPELFATTDLMWATKASSQT
jgi:hypothetical protein